LAELGSEMFTDTVLAKAKIDATATISQASNRVYAKLGVKATCGLLYINLMRRGNAGCE
jgi:hypothetical protein